MNFPTLPPPEALRRLLDQVMAGRDAVVDGPGASVLLDQAAALLAARRLRVLHAAAAGPGGLGLEELMAQVAGPPDAGSPCNSSLEQGAQALTVLDGRCDGIVLLVDDAETVQPAVLRYLQLACRTSAKLRLVLAGMPEGLDGAEFASLRARLQAQPVLVLNGALPNAVPHPAPQAQGAPAVRPEQPPMAGRLAAPASERPRLAVSATPRRTWLTAVALGMAGCIAAGVLAAHHGPEQPASAAAMAREAQSAVPPLTASEVPVAVTTLPAVEAVPTPEAASAPPNPGLAAAGQAAAEPSPMPPARPPGRSGVVSRQADARLRALPLHSDRRNPSRLARAAGRPSFSAAQQGSAWDEPSADSRDGQNYVPQGWSGGGWRRDAYPGPVSPPGYASGPYAGRDYPYEPWRPANPWWPR